MKIMIVEDSKAVHALLVEFLGADVTIVQRCYDGQSAVDALSNDSHCPDLILLDWEMPVLSGIDALPLIRDQRSNAIVLMMTSKNALADIREALERGASDYIIKPFTREILLEKIEQVTGRKIA